MLLVLGIYLPAVTAVKPAGFFRLQSIKMAKHGVLNVRSQPNELELDVFLQVTKINIVREGELAR